MYVTNNVFEKQARLIDLPDPEFFHQAIKAAIEAYETDDSLNEENIDTIKKSRTPVIYASTVYKVTPEDIFISRVEMNERARRKYLIIDADFDEGQEEESAEMYDKLIALAEKHNTQLVIYPTASYPLKPRFRAVMFTSRQMNSSQYYQAMTWLYEQLEMEPLDLSDLNMKSNNNAPVFFRDAHLSMIVDTTQEPGLKPLDNGMWKSYPRPRVSKPRFSHESNSEFDEFQINPVALLECAKVYSRSDEAQQYETFWPFMHTLARAEIVGQLTAEQIDEVLEIVASSASNEQTRLKWATENKQMYQTEKRRVQESDSYFNRAKPLLRYREFIKARVMA